MTKYKQVLVSLFYIYITININIITVLIVETRYKYFNIFEKNGICFYFWGDMQKCDTVSENIVLCVQRKLSIIFKSTKENKILIIFIIVVKNDYSIHLSIKIYPIHKCWIQCNLIQNISYNMLRAKPLSRNMFHISFEKIQSLFQNMFNYFLKC